MPHGVLFELLEDGDQGLDAEEHTFILVRRRRLLHVSEIDKANVWIAGIAARLVFTIVQKQQRTSDKLVLGLSIEPCLKLLEAINKLQI